MGKSKKKKALMFSNFLAFKAGQGNKNLSTTPLQKSNVFQTPHSEQEQLTELLDDNSPAVGPSPAGQPSRPALPNNAHLPSGSNTNPAGQFSSSSKWKPVEDTSIRVNIRQDAQRPNLTVVEGPASKIQLVIDKSKNVTVPPTHGSKSHAELQIISGSLTPPAPAPAPAPARVPAPALAPAPAPAPAPAHVPAPAPAPAPARRKPQWVPAAASAVPEPAATAAKRRKPQWTPSPAQPAPAAPAQLPNAGAGWPRSMTQQWERAQAPGGPAGPAGPALRVSTAPGPAAPAQYSPSDVYSELINNEEAERRHVSAFQRLGPLASPPARSPTPLTVNVSADASERRVLLTPAPVPLPAAVLASTDELVRAFRDQWPYAKPWQPLKTATARTSKSAMMLQTESMEEEYARDNKFVLVTVGGFPADWTRARVLDAVLDSVKGKSFIPCFIEMSETECKFLVLRSRAALLHIHKYGFVARAAEGGAELLLQLHSTPLTLAQLDFVPRVLLRRMLQARTEAQDAHLDLSAFTLAPDVSQFIYFPLARACNQGELVQLPAPTPWGQLRSLDLSRNNITTLHGLDLAASCPRLRHLDLSYNLVARSTALLPARGLSLRSLHLHANPLCRDFTDPRRYVRVLTALFPTLQSIDDVPVGGARAGLPAAARQYSESAGGAARAERFLAAFLPLLAAPAPRRSALPLLYHERARLTATAAPRLRYWDAAPLAGTAGWRALLRGAAACGREEVARALLRWPALRVRPADCALHVLLHEPQATLLVLGGLARPAEAPECALQFSRTILLRVADGDGALRVHNDLLHWDLPERDVSHDVTSHTENILQNLSLRLDEPPDEDLKQQLLPIFMQLTDLDKMSSERCLEAKDWNIKNALEYFISLLKLDNLEILMTNVGPNNYPTETHSETGYQWP